MLARSRPVLRASSAARAALLCAAAVLSALVLGGCVGQQSYDQLSDANRSLTERNHLLQGENAQMRSELDIERRNRQQAEAAAAAERQARAALQSKLDEFGIKYDDLVSRMGTIALDPMTDQALAQLARQYPDLISYDAELGMLRFNADLTFASGSDAVSDAAKKSLSALAGILNTSAALGYDVHIVGHTDAQRISASTAQRHPTNMHLSCHRAISVRRELEGLGVAAVRMMSAGWGEQRPTVPNTPSGNTPQNRRVEIFLRPSTRTSASESVGTPASIDREAPPARPADINK